MTSSYLIVARKWSTLSERMIGFFSHENDMKSFLKGKCDMRENLVHIDDAYIPNLQCYGIYDLSKEEAKTLIGKRSENWILYIIECNTDNSRNDLRDAFDSLGKIRYYTRCDNCNCSNSDITLQNFTECKGFAKFLMKIKGQPGGIIFDSRIGKHNILLKDAPYFNDEFIIGTEYIPINERTIKNFLMDLLQYADNPIFKNGRSYVFEGIAKCDEQYIICWG